MAATRTLSTADARRETVLEAAMGVFARRGLYGTPTMEIAKAAGISQAYLFRLFPTKTELFVAVVRRSSERIHETFAAAARDARQRGEQDILLAMGMAYASLLEDRDLLLVDLHAHAVCDDEEIRAEMHRGFARLVELIERESGADPIEVRQFFAQGMLLNVLTAMRADESDEHWSQLLRAAPDGPC